MEETLITFETAKLAKEKGFNWNVLHSYRDGKLDYEDYFRGTIDEMYFNANGKNRTKFKEIISTPTQSLLQKWLREEHNILVYVDPRSHHIFQYHIITEDNEIIGSDRLNNWELILEKGLQASLELI